MLGLTELYMYNKQKTYYVQGQGHFSPGNIHLLKHKWKDVENVPQNVQ